MLIFHYNEVTHDYICDSGLFPQKIMECTDIKGNATASSVQLENDNIANRFDKQATHTIEAAIIKEYARCNNMTGAAVIRVLNVQRLTHTSEKGKV